MPNNRAITEIDNQSFLKFAFRGQKQPPVLHKLTAQQQVIYDLVITGKKPKEISEITGIRYGCVYDGLGKIREKGYSV